MKAFFISMAMKLFKIQIDTTKTKSFFVGLGWVAAGISAIATLGISGDGNVLHYVAAIAPILQGLGTITKRDALTKLSQKITDNLPKQE
jgi:hypothetical protein